MELSVQNRVGSGVVRLADVSGNSHHGRKRYEEIQRIHVKDRSKYLEHPELRPSDSAESVLGLSHKQSINEVENHQEASTDRGCKLLSKGTHRFDISSVEGFNPKDKIVPRLEISELLFRCNGVSYIQEGSTSS